jgi:hypothetical protein
MFCAAALYRGSRDQPDTKFVKAVRASVTMGAKPNFDTANEPCIDPHPQGPPPASVTALDYRIRHWSSALFRIETRQPDATPSDPNQQFACRADALV